MADGFNQAQQSSDGGRNQAINNLAQVIKAAFPVVTGIAVTAGAASGKYMTIIGTDGNPYKIALLLP